MGQSGSRDLFIDRVFMKGHAQTTPYLAESMGSGLSIDLMSSFLLVSLHRTQAQSRYEGAFYHVIVRGNQQQRTFHDDQDRIAYLERLEHYRQRYGFRLFAFCLMSNDVRLLLKTKSVPLSKIMQGTQFSGDVGAGPCNLNNH